MSFITLLGFTGLAIFLLSSVSLMITLTIYERSDVGSPRFERKLALFCLTGVLGLILLTPHVIVSIFF